MKRPAFQFYPADWRKDAELQGCSIGARGLWHELLCVMHECKPYGHLALNGEAIPEAKAARLVGVEVKEYRKLFAELDAAGVPSRTDQGIVYSRRMVRDEALRAVRAESGSKGGNPALLIGRLNQTLGAKVGREVNQASKQTPTPSSSSSSSSSSVVQNPSDDARAPDGNNALEIKKNGKTERWDASDQGIDAKGRELGLKPKPGESYFDFKGRLWGVINEQSRVAR